MTVIVYMSTDLVK